VRVRTRRDGFTLLEVLIATVILALAVVGVLSALSTSVRNAGRLTDRDRAAMLAKRKMEELLTERRLPRNVVLGGVYEPLLTGGLSAGWKAQVTAFEVPPNVAPGQNVLDRVTVQIWWTVGGRTQTMEIESFRRAPTLPDEVAGGALIPR
jgi:general secretion pathway protein I